MTKRDTLESAADELSAHGSAASSSAPVAVSVNTSTPTGSASASAAGTPTSVASSSVNASANGNAPPSVSAVWAYFDKDALGNSLCKFCDRVIKGHHSSNLLSHLRTAGRTDAAHAQASAICEEHRETKRHVKRQKLAMPTAAEFAATYPHLVAAAAAAAVPAFGGAQFAAALKKDNAFYPSSSAALAAAAAAATLSKEQHHHTTQGHVNNVIAPGQVTCSADQLAQDFALMVLTENLPINFATQPGFQNFAQLLLADKKSMLPDEDAVLKNILMLQQSLTLTSKMLLARARGVAISVESWRHPSPEISATAKYLAVAAHFSINFRTYHITLSCTPVGTGVDVASFRSLVEQTLERAGVKDKVIACVVGDLAWRDDADGGITSGDLPCAFVPTSLDGRLMSGESHPTHVIPCAATLLRQCIKKSVFAASFPHHILAIDDFFRRLAQHSEAFATLKRKCPLLDPVMLIDDEAFAAASRSYNDVLRDVHDALSTLETIAEDHQLEFLSPVVIEWITVVSKKLRPFARYADAFEAEKQKRNGSDKEVHKDSISNVSTIAAFLVEYVEKQVAGVSEGGDATDVLSWKAFYMMLAKDLRARFSHLSPQSLAATLLDPRYKDRDCCYLEPELERVAAEGYLRRLLEIPGDDSAAGARAATANGDKEARASNGTDVNEDEDDDLLAQLPSTGSRDAAQEGNELVASWTNELTAFLSLPLAERNVDPMAWWKANQLRFPLLAPCAELLLALPAAATSGETTLSRVNQTLLRVEGFALDRSIATTPTLVDAFLSFQKNRENVIEWFRSNSTVLADPSALSEIEAANFKHVENV